MIFLGIVVLLVIMFVSGARSGDPRISPISVVIGALCLVAALYLERWVFDKSSGYFERHVGLIFAYNTKRIPLSELACVVLMEPRSGRKRMIDLGGMTDAATVLFLMDDQGRRHHLDMSRGPASARLNRAADQISTFCEIPLTRSQPDADSGHGSTDEHAPGGYPPEPSG